MSIDDVSVVVSRTGVKTEDYCAIYITGNGRHLSWHALSTSGDTGNAWSNLMTCAIKLMSSANCNLLHNKYVKCECILQIEQDINIIDTMKDIIRLNTL